VPKPVWRVKLVAELEPGVTTEAELARIGRGEAAGLAELGLRLAEAKRLTAALQARIVPARVATAGERRRRCAACGAMLAGKGGVYRAVRIQATGAEEAPATGAAAGRCSFPAKSPTAQALIVD
jgi:hypothetical protein